MKKLIFLLMCLALSAFMLTGCLLPGVPGGGPNPPAGGGEGNRVLIDDETTVRIILQNNSTSLLGAAELISDAAEKMGATVIICVAGDDMPLGDTDIYLGNPGGSIVANKAATAVNEYKGDELYGAYAICSYAYSVAISAELGFGYTVAAEYFIESYLSGDTFELDSDEIEVVTGIDEYPFDEDAFAERFDYYNDYFDEDTVKELIAFYGIYTSDLIDWLANLYDPEVGGFYYANSSRDYMGFLPDIESTGQLLGVVSGYGAMVAFENKWVNALPDDIVAAIGNWIYNLQDPDGYFYQPQWGKDVSTSRKGRNFDSAMSILNKLGIKPKYGNPLAASYSHESELTAPLGQSAVVAVSYVIPAARLDSYLQSEEAFLEWLEALNINEHNKSYPAGHTISSVRTQIQAAGLADFCIDWLNSKQLDNGLWEEGELTYNKLNGLLKISTCYSDFGVPFPRIELGIQACIDAVLLEDKVSAVVDIYNPWVALGILVPNVKQFGSQTSYENAKALLFDNAEELIRKTKEKVLVFRKDDGSFSYLPEKSSPTSQGEIASLGFKEGDVNGTGLALGALGNMMRAFELTRVEVFTPVAGENFIKTVSTIGATVKIEQEVNKLDFDDCESIEELPAEISIQWNQFNTTSHPETLGTWSLLSHADHPDDLYVDLVSRAGTGDQFRVTFPTAIGSCSFFEGRVKFAGGGLQIFFRNENSKEVLMLSVSDAGSDVVFSDVNATSGATITTDILFKLKKNVWYDLRIEYYDFEDGTAKTKFIVNGTTVAISDNFIGNGTAAPLEKFNHVEFRATINAATGFSVDDIICDSENIDYDDSDYTPPKNENEVQTFDDAGLGGDLPEIFTKSATAAGGAESFIAERDGDDLYYRMSSNSAAGDTLKLGVKQTGTGVIVFETDIIFESMSVNSLQLFIGDAVMLSFDRSGSGIVIKDANARSNANIKHTLATLEYGVWYSMRVEYHVTDDGPYVKLYLNGDCVAISRNYVGNGIAGKTPVTTFMSVQMYATIGGTMTVGFDNVYADYDSELEYDDYDYDGEIIGEWVEAE